MVYKLQGHTLHEILIPRAVTILALELISESSEVFTFTFSVVIKIFLL